MVSLDDTDMYTSDNEREDDIPAASDDTWFRDQLTQLSNPKPNYTEPAAAKGIPTFIG